MELMKDPVTVSTGITYDRESIEHWVYTCKKKTCPATMQELQNLELTPNHMFDCYFSGKNVARWSSMDWGCFFFLKAQGERVRKVPNKQNVLLCKEEESFSSRPQQASTKVWKNTELQTEQRKDYPKKEAEGLSKSKNNKKIEAFRVLLKVGCRVSDLLDFRAEK